MIQYIEGDIFESECSTLVNPVNSIGVMGAGLAKQFAKRFPKMCEHYNVHVQAYYKRQRDHLIPPMIIPRKTRHWDCEKYILMFPTKVHWEDESKLEYIKENMPLAIDTINRLKIPSIAFPKLGCGLGGLEWQTVEPIMIENLNDYDGEVEIYV